MEGCSEGREKSHHLALGYLTSFDRERRLSLTALGEVLVSFLCVRHFAHFPQALALLNPIGLWDTKWVILQTSGLFKGRRLKACILRNNFSSHSGYFSAASWQALTLCCAPFLYALLSERELHSPPPSHDRESDLKLILSEYNYTVQEFQLRGS